MVRVFCAVFIMILCGCAPLSETCSNGGWRTCSLSDGTAGTQTCSDRRWGECRTGSSTSDAGTMPADGGMSLTDTGASPGSDSGASPGTDSGSSGTGDTGTSSGSDTGSGGTTPESVARAACAARTFGSSTSRLVVTYDEACLDRLFGACPTHWRFTGWDAAGCAWPADPGSGSLELDYVHRRGGYYQFSVACGSARFDGWPAGDRNQAVNTACITSARFEDGVELADNEARFCPGLSDMDSLIVTVPAQPGVVANCP